MGANTRRLYEWINLPGGSGAGNTVVFFCYDSGKALWHPKPCCVFYDSKQ